MKLTGLLLLLAAAPSLAAASDAQQIRQAAALSSGYFEELDLPMYYSLEQTYAACCRVIESANEVTFGPIVVRAKLVVPRNITPVKGGFFGTPKPDPLRIMLDFALVSCRTGCTVSLLADGVQGGRKLHARHEAQIVKVSRPVPNAGFHKGPRTASMVRIEGKDRAAAIELLNASLAADIFLNTAVHGPAHFKFVLPPAELN